MQNLSKLFLKDHNLAALPSDLESGRFPLLISGTSQVHRAAISSAIYSSLDRPLVIICPDESSAEELSRDVYSFSNIRPRILTSREFNFQSYEGMSKQVEQARIMALDGLLNDGRSIVISTVSALLQRTIDPSVFDSLAFELRPGEGKSSPEAIEERLLLSGYKRAELVEGAGQYSRRGGILDIFSPYHDMPVRCEFWGDEIDSMGFFDVSSQRRSENAEFCRILPSSEVLPSLYPKGLDGLSEAVKSIIKRPSPKTMMLKQTLDEDADRLKNLGNLPWTDRYLSLISPEKKTALDYLPIDSMIVMCEPSKTAERARAYEKQLNEDVKVLIEGGKLAGPLSDFYLSFDALCNRLSDYPSVMLDSFTLGRYPLQPKKMVTLLSKQLPSYGGSLETALEDVSSYLSRGYRVIVLASDERKVSALSEFFAGKNIKASISKEITELPDEGSCSLSVGSLSQGFELTDLKLAVLSDSQILYQGISKKVRKKAAAKGQRIQSFSDLSVGDLIVHEYHGIGRFMGISRMKVDGVFKDYIKLAYAGTDSLYLPATSLDLITKYIGVGEDRPVKLSKMGGADWTRVKTKAKTAAKGMAKELIKLYAERDRLEGFAFSPDSDWQREFELSFPYEETEDQIRCIEEIKRDMQKPRPMDRLLCGDVGYGKTEVALRAVMKCVLDGKQAAILVPTTVLAQQHYQTAMQRFFGFPVRIEMLSRFRTATESKAAVQGILNGSCDIVIGTHKLLQKNLKFKNLGLLIIDEEQRFGVSHKERLKEMSRGVDVLTLSATPIPRTLNMALSGIRDMSTLEEPPQDRQPVQTHVLEHDWHLIADAIAKEVQRGGQVYYLRNRVEGIERVAGRLSEMLDNVSVSVAHGQMDQRALSGVMERMTAGEISVLVCTTIIETGIDIPNVNTLIIEDADKLGLSQLHQIRGRVGRSGRRASAYLTFKKDKVLTEIAEKRLSAVREFCEFNSGFKIAMRDLEIRGAGNLLGAEQSGHMISVGYDMYLKLLEEAVIEEKGGRAELKASCSADIAVSANIPELYIQSSEQRMDLYRRIASIKTEDDAEDLIDELIDRFGDIPSETHALIQVALLRADATRAGIREIYQKESVLFFELSDFDMEKVSALYGQNDYKGRLKVEAGQKPRLSLRLKSAKRVLDEARGFVQSYLNNEAAKGETAPANDGEAKSAEMTADRR
ncbi:transcription-repair coupling factor [Clostridiaceae bacterium OttesenSCG-928-D20]|nr:transcription-repair coupling factor [Clostridiaceae bacterium OttesenSCG-928-D20]